MEKKISHKKNILLIVIISIVVLAIILFAHSYICTNSLIYTGLTKYCNSNLIIYDFGDQSIHDITENYNDEGELKNDQDDPQEGTDEQYDNGSESEILPKSIMLEIPIVKQAHRASCEVASLRASMLYYGVDKSEEYLLEQVTYDTSPRYLDEYGQLYWGDPQKGYVGNVDAPVIYVDGYGVYNEPIYRALRQNGFTKSISKVGWDPEEMYNYLRQSYPVIVWISNDYATKDVQYWIAPDGTQVKWFVGEHAVVLRGIDENYVYVMDVGYGANKQVPIVEFEKGFANLDNMAIVVIPD